MGTVSPTVLRAAYKSLAYNPTESCAAEHLWSVDESRMPEPDTKAGLTHAHTRVQETNREGVETAADRKEDGELADSLRDRDEHDTDNRPGNQDAERAASVKGATTSDEETGTDSAAGRTEA